MKSPLPFLATGRTNTPRCLIQRALAGLCLAASLLSACAGGLPEPAAAPGASAAATDTPAVVETLQVTPTPPGAGGSEIAAAAVHERTATDASASTDVPPTVEAARALEPTATAAPPLAAKEGTLTIWAEPGQAAVLAELGRQFTARYGFAVVVQPVSPADLRARFAPAARSGQGPDVLYGPHTWLDELASGGLVDPLDLGEKASDLDPAARQAFTYHGQLYGLPTHLDSLALIYNSSLVPDPPKTWDELKMVAQRLQQEGQVERGFVLSADALSFEPLLTGFGGYLFGQGADGSYATADVGLDSPGGLAAANELDALVKAGLLQAPPDGAAPGEAEVVAMLTQGRAALGFASLSTARSIQRAAVHYRVAPLPMMQAQPRPYVTARGLLVSATGKNRLLAITFLRDYAATDAAMQGFLAAEPGIPAWLPARAGVNAPEVRVLAEMAALGQPLPGLPEMGEIWEAQNKAIRQIMLQEQPPEQAFREAASAIRALVQVER